MVTDGVDEGTTFFTWVFFAAVHEGGDTEFVVVDDGYLGVSERTCPTRGVDFNTRVECSVSDHHMPSSPVADVGLAFDYDTFTSCLGRDKRRASTNVASVPESLGVVVHNDITVRTPLLEVLEDTKGLLVHRRGVVLAVVVEPKEDRAVLRVGTVDLTDVRGPFAGLRQRARTDHLMRDNVTVQIRSVPVEPHPDIVLPFVGVLFVDHNEAFTHTRHLSLVLAFLEGADESPVLKVVASGEVQDEAVVVFGRVVGDAEVFEVAFFGVGGVEDVEAVEAFAVVVVVVEARGHAAAVSCVADLVDGVRVELRDEVAVGNLEELQVVHALQFRHAAAGVACCAVDGLVSAVVGGHTMECVLIPRASLQKKACQQRRVCQRRVVLLLQRPDVLGQAFVEFVDHKVAHVLLIPKVPDLRDGCPLIQVNGTEQKSGVVAFGLLHCRIACLFLNWGETEGRGGRTN